jgi:hypothetical protein
MRCCLCQERMSDKESELHHLINYHKVKDKHSLQSLLWKDDGEMTANKNLARPRRNVNDHTEKKKYLGYISKSKSHIEEYNDFS